METRLRTEKAHHRKKAKNSWESQLFHFINYQNVFNFDVNLLNLQMYYFQILHIYMCGVCSPPVLGDLARIMHRMIWKRHMVQRLQHLPNCNSTTHHSECLRSKPDRSGNITCYQPRFKGIAHSSRVDHQIQSGSGLQHSLHESFLLDLSTNGDVRDCKACQSLLCPFWSVQWSSLQSCMSQVFAESSFTCLKRWVSFTWRKPLHSLMVAHSQPFSPGLRSNTAQWKDKYPNPGWWRRKEGLKKMRREVGSKPPTSCNAILFKSNTFRNPVPPLYPQFRAPLSGCDLKRNNTKVTQLHPSALGNSETSSKKRYP